MQLEKYENSAPVLYSQDAIAGLIVIAVCSYKFILLYRGTIQSKLLSLSIYKALKERE